MPTGGGGLSILGYASDDRKKAAWEVLKFLSSGDAAIEWTLGTGYMPTTKAALESDKVKAKAGENPNYQVAIDQLEIAQGPDVVRKFVPEAVPEMKGAIQAVYSGNADAEKTLKTVQANLEPALEKVRAKYDAKVGA